MRAIVLNLGRNNRQNDVCFNEWIKHVKEFRLFSFMHKFMKFYHSYRSYMKESYISRNRDKMKGEMIYNTIDYLEKFNFINKGLINKAEIKKLMELNTEYRNDIAPDMYMEIIDEIFSNEYTHDKEKIRTDWFIKTIIDTFYFDLASGLCVVDCSGVYKMMKIINSKTNRGVTNYNTIKIALLQSPDFLAKIDKRIYAQINPHTKIEKRGRGLIAIKISRFNRDYLTDALMYKMRSYEDNEHVLRSMCNEHMEHAVNIPTIVSMESIMDDKIEVI